MTSRLPLRTTTLVIIVVMSLVALSGIIALAWPPAAPGRGVASSEALFAKVKPVESRQTLPQTVVPLLPAVGELGWETDEIGTFSVMNTGTQLPQLLQCQFLQDVSLAAPGVRFSVPHSYRQVSVEGLTILIEVADTAQFTQHLVADLYGCKPGANGRYAWGKPKALTSRLKGPVTIRQWQHPVEYARGESGTVYRSVLSTTSHIEVLSLLVPDEWPDWERDRVESAHTRAVNDAVEKLSAASKRS